MSMGSTRDVWSCILDTANTSPSESQFLTEIVKALRDAIGCCALPFIKRPTDNGCIGGGGYFVFGRVRVQNVLLLLLWHTPNVI